MIEAGDLKTGVTLRIENNLYRVTKTTYNKPGRGKASMQTVLLDIRTGNTIQRVFGVEDRLDNIFVDVRSLSCLRAVTETLERFSSLPLFFVSGRFATFFFLPTPGTGGRP